MENCGSHNEAHIFCLHYNFIPRINRSLAAFKDAWNFHPMCGLSPNQLNSFLQSTCMHVCMHVYRLCSLFNSLYYYAFILLCFSRLTHTCMMLIGAKCALVFNIEHYSMGQITFENLNCQLPHLGDTSWRISQFVLHAWASVSSAHHGAVSQFLLLQWIEFEITLFSIVAWLLVKNSWKWKSCHVQFWTQRVWHESFSFLASLASWVRKQLLDWVH